MYVFDLFDPEELRVASTHIPILGPERHRRAASESERKTTYIYSFDDCRYNLIIELNISLLNQFVSFSLTCIVLELPPTLVCFVSSLDNKQISGQTRPRIRSLTYLGYLSDPVLIQCRIAQQQQRSHKQYLRKEKIRWWASR